MSLADLKGDLAAFLDHQQRVMTVFQSMTAMIERQDQEIQARGLLLAEILMLLEKYLARTRTLAEQGIINFQNAKATKFANRLQTGASKKPKGSLK